MKKEKKVKVICLIRQKLLKLNGEIKDEKYYEKI